MALEEIFMAQRPTKIVEFPAQEFNPIISSYALSGDFARIDLYVVEEFLYKLEEFAKLPSKRVKVYEDSVVCVLEVVEEKGRKRVKHTRIDGLKRRWIELISFLLKKRQADVEEIMGAVFGKPQGCRGTVYNTISQLDTFLLDHGYGFSIAKNSEGKYQIQFVD